MVLTRISLWFLSRSTTTCACCCLNMQLFSQLVFTCQDSDEMRCSASPFELWNFRKTSATKKKKNKKKTVALNWKKQLREREREKGYCMYVIRSLFLNEHDVTTQLALGMSGCAFPIQRNLLQSTRFRLSQGIITHKGMPSPANRIQNQSPREWGDSCDSAQKGCNGIPSVSSLNLRGS